MRDTDHNIFLTIVAAVSLCLGTFWYVESTRVYADDSSPVSLALLWGPSLFSLLLLLISSRSLVPLRLPPAADHLPLTLPLIVASVLAYALLAPLFWLLAKAIVVLLWPNPNHAEASIFVGLFVLFLPPWWAPLFGSLGAWWWIRRRLTSTARAVPPNPSLQRTPPG